MARITMNGSGDADHIAALLASEVRSSGFTCELLEDVSRSLGTARVHVLIFEKYYMRSSNRASLTVVIIGDGGRVTVDAIGSGGGQDALFRFSWGAEENFVGTVGRILEGHGFR